MAMFIQALKQLGDLDMLFYVRPDLPVSAELLTDAEERLSRLWDARLKVELCNLEREQSASGLWDEYIGPALSIRRCPPFDTICHQRQIDAARKILSREPDLVFIHRLACMVPVLMSERPHPRMLFDLDDIEHVAFVRGIKQPPHWPGKKLRYLRLPILKQWERRAVHDSHTSFVCSEHDRRLLSAAFHCDNVMVAPNAVVISSPPKPAPRGLNLLFLGRFSYEPNRAAADYMIKKIWPAVHARLPDARLIIAGAAPGSISAYSDKPGGVEFRGFVHDLHELYAKVAVVCCPILAGGGTRIKILEAASHGRPVISTTLGCEGLELRDGVEILIRDEPTEFAQACVELLLDPQRAARIGEASRMVVAEKYDMRLVIQRISDYVRRIASERNAEDPALYATR
jgi:glycosyltransferase involved in cell wall biosynthesis